jgi:hypothetical protein
MATEVVFSPWVISVPIALAVQRSSRVEIHWSGQCLDSSICKGGLTFSRSATACVTDYYYYSLDDVAPAWNIDCETRSTGWTVLRMSSADLPTISALSDITSIDVSTVTPPASKTTVYITPSETSTSTTSSSSSSSSAPPTPGMLAVLQ